MRRIAVGALMVTSVLGAVPAGALTADEAHTGGQVRDGAPEAVVVVGRSGTIGSWEGSTGGGGARWRCGYYAFDLDPVRVPQKYPGKRAWKGPHAGEYTGHPLGKNPGDVWIFPNVKSNHVEKTIHPCQFPVELVERFVRGSAHPGAFGWVIAGVGFLSTALMVLYDRLLAGGVNDSAGRSPVGRSPYVSRDGRPPQSRAAGIARGRRGSPGGSAGDPGGRGAP